jgi:hypothetical protein
MTLRHGGLSSGPPHLGARQAGLPSCLNNEEDPTLIILALYHRGWRASSCGAGYEPCGLITATFSRDLIPTESRSTVITGVMTVELNLLSSFCIPRRRQEHNLLGREIVFLPPAGIHILSEKGDIFGPPSDPLVLCIGCLF